MVWDTRARNGVGPTPAPVRIVYGAALPGFATVTGPKRLTAGCYTIEIYGGGGSAEASFQVDVSRGGASKPTT